MSFVHRYIPVEGAERTLLVLHGTGGNEESLLSIAEKIAPDMNLLSPRGKVLENGMPRFFRRFAEGVFDVEDIQRQAADLAAFVNESASEQGFDPGLVTAFGYSNGANIASSLLLLHPQVLAGAILVRGMVPLVPDPLPDLAGKRVLILNGLHDPIGPPEESERLRSLLEKTGAQVELRLSEAGHELTRSDINAASYWLGKG